VWSRAVRRSRVDIGHDRRCCVLQKEECSIGEIVANVIDSKEVKELSLRPIWWTWCVRVDQSNKIWLPYDHGVV